MEYILEKHKIEMISFKNFYWKTFAKSQRGEVKDPYDPKQANYITVIGRV